MDETRDHCLELIAPVVAGFKAAQRRGRQTTIWAQRVRQHGAQRGDGGWLARAERPHGLDNIGAGAPISRKALAFLGFSYGFRPGRGAHDALDALAFGIERRKVSWIVDADLRAYFYTIPRDWLITFLAACRTEVRENGCGRIAMWRGHGIERLS